MSSSDLIVYFTSALLVFGMPALAIVLIYYFKLRERELILKLGAEQRTASSTEERLQRVEEAVERLERAVHPQAALPDILEAPAEGQRAPPASTKAR